MSESPSVEVPQQKNPVPVTFTPEQLQRIAEDLRCIAVEVRLEIAEPEKAKKASRKTMQTMVTV